MMNLKLIVEEEYGQCFDEICFAIYGSENGRNITTFRSVFENKYIYMREGEWAADVNREGVAFPGFTLQRRGLGAGADQNRHGREERLGPVTLQVVELWLLV